MFLAKLRSILKAYPLANKNISHEVFKTMAAVTIRTTFLARPFCSQPGHIVQMRGLGNETIEKDVIDFFKSLGIVPTAVRLKFDGSGRVAMGGVSEVEFATHAEAVVALRKKNSFLGNRFVRLTLKSSEVAGNELKQTDTKFDQSPTPKADLNIAAANEGLYRPVGHVVRMRNVPWRTTEQAIYEFFWPVNAICTSAKPLYNESGIRTGEFDVEFLTKGDAVRAMSKNNAYLGRKFVELSFKER